MSDSILGCIVSKDAAATILKREFTFSLDFGALAPSMLLTVIVEATEQNDVNDNDEAKTLACTKASTVKAAFIVVYGTTTSSDASFNGPVTL